MLSESFWLAFWGGAAWFCIGMTACCYIGYQLNNWIRQWGIALSNYVLSQTKRFEAEMLLEKALAGRIQAEQTLDEAKFQRMLLERDIHKANVTH